MSLSQVCSKKPVCTGPKYCIKPRRWSSASCCRTTSKKFQGRFSGTIHSLADSFREHFRCRYSYSLRKYCSCEDVNYMGEIGQVVQEVYGSYDLLGDHQTTQVTKLPDTNDKRKQQSKDIRACRYQFDVIGFYQGLLQSKNHEQLDECSEECEKFAGHLADTEDEMGPGIKRTEEIIPDILLEGSDVDSVPQRSSIHSSYMSLASASSMSEQNTSSRQSISSSISCSCDNLSGLDNNDDLDTSYWNLHIPDRNTPSPGCPSPLPLRSNVRHDRSYSLSIPSSKLTSGLSPNRTPRRLSESAAGTGSLACRLSGSRFSQYHSNITRRLSESAAGTLSGLPPIFGRQRAFSGTSDNKPLLYKDIAVLARERCKLQEVLREGARDTCSSCLPVPSLDTRSVRRWCASECSVETNGLLQPDKVQKGRRNIQRSRSADSRDAGHKAAMRGKRGSSWREDKTKEFSDIESSEESDVQIAGLQQQNIESLKSGNQSSDKSSLTTSDSSGPQTGHSASSEDSSPAARIRMRLQKKRCRSESVEGKQTGSRRRRGDGEKMEFRSMSLEDLMFCSGAKGNNSAGTDDVEKVFEAISKETKKHESEHKDMMVMFFVGGEFKVLRRTPQTSHGDRARYSEIPPMTRQDFIFHNGSNNHNFSGHDGKRARPKSAIIISRSQSFAGMAQPPHVQRRDPGAVVLGESFKHRGSTMQLHNPKVGATGARGSQGFSFKKSPKVPKVPRPNRALLMFHSVKRGIREFIEATKEDIDQLHHKQTDGTSTAQGKLHETDKQIKSAERYLKRLEFHLSKLDELHEFYLLQQQLREGVRTMHRAYVTSPGNQKSTLSNVKYGYKECTQTMCNIEAQLEAMMGTFNCKLKGMAGFARLCPGDVFEVTVRHGTQKWKTKGRIEKTGNQKWDIPEFNFKAVVGDIINIKGVEVRAFKSVLLGQKSCETKDLFSANPQLMTVSINVNGSLKLSIVITWNPLEGADDSLSLMETPLRQQGTPRRRPVSVIALNGQYDREYEDYSRERAASLTTVHIQQTKDDNFILRSNVSPPQTTNNVTSYHGLDSPQVSARLTEHLPSAYQHTNHSLQSQSAVHTSAGFHSTPVLPGVLESETNGRQSTNQNSALPSSLPPRLTSLSYTGGEAGVSSARDDSEASMTNIEDVLHNLSSSLEDYHGQYVELQKLEDLVKLAQKYIRKQFRNSSRSSSISVSIEDALEAFDFLDTEDTVEESHSPTNGQNKPSYEDMLCSPESTAKTADSGIESLAQRLSEDTQLGSSLGSSPVPPSTGNEEVDQCLMYHLTYCERLLENLGAFGPMKCREIYALDKIQKQTLMVEDLLRLAKSSPVVDLHQAMASICNDKTLKEFWVKCTDQNTLYIHPDRLLNMLEQKFAALIKDKYKTDPVRVCEHVITRVLDIPDYESEKGRSYFVVTLHQFMSYFSEEGGLDHVEAVTEEMKLVEKLTCGHPDTVIKAVLTLRDTVPSAPCLKVIGMLLVTMDTEVEQCIISYLNLIQRRLEHREKAMIVYVEGLEDRTPEIRAGACAALAILEADESIDQLVYLWQSDSSPLVQKSAKQAVLSLGEEGKKAFEEAQLSKHGFQGLQVHK